MFIISKMPDATLRPLLDTEETDFSILVGAPAQFNLAQELERARSIRIAMAFGRISGWNEIGSHLERSQAGITRILLGQAFFQTEPELLLNLQNIQKASASREFDTKLASADVIFHPKVWIVEGALRPFSIVGSGNLTRGGLAKNIECGAFCDRSSDVDALREWFDRRWFATFPLSRTLEHYRTKFDQIRRERTTMEKKIEAAQKALSDEEARWRKSRAVSLAVDYWNSEAGQKEIQDRKAAISQMRNMLDYPSFNFTKEQFSQFLRVPLLGQIRLGPNEANMLSSIEKIKASLQAMSAHSGGAMKALDDLQKIRGLKRNVATKLLAVYDPKTFPVVNGPVEKALHRFGYDLESESSISSQEYGRFLREVQRLIDECETAGLLPAAALDAFFYAYSELEATGLSSEATSEENLR